MLTLLVLFSRSSSFCLVTGQVDLSNTAHVNVTISITQLGLFPYALICRTAGVGSKTGTDV